MKMTFGRTLGAVFAGYAVCGANYGPNILVSSEAAPSWGQEPYSPCTGRWYRPTTRRPTTAHDPAALRVIPPDETTQLSMAFGAGQLCQHGDITVGAFSHDLLVDG
jgi:hypothetical protein